MGNKNSKLIDQVILTPWDLIGQTLSEKEREKIGLSDDVMMLVFKQMSHLEYGELSLKEVKGIEFRTKLPPCFRVRKTDLVRLLREFPRNGFLSATEKMDKDYFYERDLEELGLTEKKLKKFFTSIVLLEKIKFERHDFVELYLHEPLMRLSPSYRIRINLHRKEDKDYDFAKRARICPLREKRCEIYFQRAHLLGYERYSCTGCVFFEAEKKFIQKSSNSTGYSTHSSIFNAPV